MNETLQDILYLLFTPTAVVALIVFLSKSYISRFITNTFDLSLIEYENQIKTITDQSNYRYSVYHSKKVETLGELFGLLHFANRKVLVLVGSVFDSDKPLAEEKKETAEAYNEMVQFFNSRRIYLDESLCQQFEELLSKYSEALRDFDDITYDGVYERGKEYSEKRKNSFGIVTATIPTMLLRIEKAFKEEIIEAPSSTLIKKSDS